MQTKNQKFDLSNKNKNPKSFNVKIAFEDKKEFFFSLQALYSSTENALLALALNENSLVDKQKYGMFLQPQIN